jgi:hypothetical protein
MPFTNLPLLDSLTFFIYYADNILIPLSSTFADGFVGSCGNVGVGLVTKVFSCESDVFQFLNLALTAQEIHILCTAGNP